MASGIRWKGRSSKVGVADLLERSGSGPLQKEKSPLVKIPVPGNSFHANVDDKAFSEKTDYDRSGEIEDGIPSPRPGIESDDVEDDAIDTDYSGTSDDNDDEDDEQSLSNAGLSRDKASKAIRQKMQNMDSSDEFSSEEEDADLTDSDDDQQDFVVVDKKEMEEFSSAFKPAPLEGAGSRTDSGPMAGMPALERKHLDRFAEDGKPLCLVNPYGHDPTVWFEYPKWLNMTRNRSGHRIEAVPDARLQWHCYWERNCLKDVFKIAGFKGGKRKPSNGSGAGKASNNNSKAARKRFQILWQKHLKPSEWRELGPSQRHNHFSGSRALGRKDDLSINIAKKKRLHPHEYNFSPEAYVLPHSSGRLRQFLQGSRRRTTWIKKPLSSSQGRGIRVVSDKTVMKMVTVQARRSSKAGRALPNAVAAQPCSSNSNATGGSGATNGNSKMAVTLRQQAMRGCVIQRYIERPLLINRYKFDVRVYVLVTSYNPLRAYIFPEGLARFCTEKYSLKSKKNRYGHLTNYSINKKNETFEFNKDADDDSVGSKWSLSALWRYMGEKYGGEALDKIRQDCKDVIAKTLIAGDDDINSKMNARVANPESCFELFGFDLMLDKNFKVWLVEVNISPSLMTASPLDKKVKTILVCDTLNLVGVPLGKRAPNAGTSSVYSASTASSSASCSTASSASSRRMPRSNPAHPARHLAQPKTKAPRSSAGRNVLSIAKKNWASLKADDRQVVENAVAEYSRRGHFERVFPPVKNPAKHAELIKLFTAQRYNNALLQRFEADALHEYVRITGQHP